MLKGVLVHIWVVLNVPRPGKFKSLIDELVGKYKSIFRKREGFKIYLDLQKKDSLNKNIHIFVIIRQASNFVQFRILSMLYMYKETPAVILLVNFGLLGRKLRY